MRNRLRGWTVAIVAFASFAAACGSEGGGSAGPSTAPPATEVSATAQPSPTVPEVPPPVTEPAELPLADSFRGVTAEAIKLGVVHIDLEPLRGLVDLDHGDYEGAYRALIDDINDRGGVSGRRLEPVFAKYVPVGTTEMDAACVSLTEDAQVFAVVGDLIDDGPLCYVELNDTALFGSTMTDARLARARAPWFAAARNADDAMEVILRGFHEKGVFEGATVGVVAVAADEAQLNDQVLPLLEELGVAVVDVDVIESSFVDEVATRAEVEVMASRQESVGVDTVLTIGQAGPVYAGGIEDVALRPRIATTSLGALRAFIRDRTGRDLSILEGSVAGNQLEQLGWWDDPEIQSCIDIYEAAGGDTILDPNTREPDEPENLVSIAQACRYLRPFVAMLEAAGPDLTNDSLAAAGASLGEFHVPGLGTAHYGTDTPDGAIPIHFYEWDDTVRDLRRTDTLG